MAWEQAISAKQESGYLAIKQGIRAPSLHKAMLERHTELCMYTIKCESELDNAAIVIRGKCHQLMFVCK